jgi:hypothetical protein
MIEILSFENGFVDLLRDSETQPSVVGIKITFNQSPTY